MIDHSINCREGPIPPIKSRTRELVLLFITSAERLFRGNIGGIDMDSAVGHPWTSAENGNEWLMNE